MNRSPLGHVMVGIGAALVVAFFGPWVDLLGQVKVSGWSIAYHDNHWLFLVPLAGLALAVVAASGARYTRLAGALIGAGILGYTGYEILHGVLDMDGGALLTLGGAVVALTGISSRRRALRAIGGAMALIGFFAPWISASGFDLASGHPGAELAGMWLAPLWVIPVGALAAGGASLLADRRGAVLAGVGGGLVAGGFTWFVGSAMNVVAGWGLWLTLLAAAAALAGAALAPGARSAGGARTA